MIKKNQNSFLDSISYLTEKSLTFNDFSFASKDYSSEAVENQLKIILSEVQELVDAFKNETPINVAAEAVDVIVTTIGLLQKLDNAGLDVSKVTELIADKNLEKFTTNPEDAHNTVKYYEKQGVWTNVFFNKDFGVYSVLDSNGKIRKPIGFISVKLDDVALGNLQYSFPKKQ